jgi:hypothetical protein
LWVSGKNTNQISNPKKAQKQKMAPPILSTTSSARTPLSSSRVSASSEMEDVDEEILDKQQHPTPKYESRGQIHHMPAAPTAHQNDDFDPNHVLPSPPLEPTWPKREIAWILFVEFVFVIINFAAFCDLLIEQFVLSAVLSGVAYFNYRRKHHPLVMFFFFSASVAFQFAPILCLVAEYKFRARVPSPVPASAVVCTRTPTFPVTNSPSTFAPTFPTTNTTNNNMSMPMLGL